MWQQYAARAWPTLAVIDPEGYVVATMAGEGHADGLTRLIDDLTRLPASETVRSDFLVLLFFAPHMLFFKEILGFGWPTLPNLFITFFSVAYLIIRAMLERLDPSMEEAAHSLGFTRAQQLRLIIIPQAMRTMIPPVTNQYLNTRLSIGRST